MIVEFSVANYRSFNRLQTLSFKATGLVSEDKSVDEKNIVDVDKTRCLKIAAIYGPNGGGKSNLLEAFQFLTNMIVSSIEIEELGRFTIHPFHFLNSFNSEDGGYFQIVILIDGAKYRYGFTIDQKGKIQGEWLFGPAKHNETFYFKRERNKPVDINEDWFFEGKNLPADKLRDDSLFLTFCSAYDGQISRKIRDVFKLRVSFEGNSRYPVTIPRTRRTEAATNLLVEGGHKDLVLAWFREVGIFYDDIQINKAEDLRGKDQVGLVKYLNKKASDKKDDYSGSVMLELDKDESQGTRKYYRYIGLLIEKFEKGGILVADEIDNNFHPSLLKKLISLFQNSQINKANAQLLFTSHDTNLMNPDCMRRDQFYFAEKTDLLDTKLYSLSDLKGIRNNADFARQYLSGAYGALPILGNYLEENQTNID